MLGDPVGKPSSLLASETDPSDTVRYQSPPAVEDRGTAHYIWADAKHAAFSPFPNATTHYEISAPIGWSFKPHPMQGVILQSTFFVQLNAAETLGYALTNSGGFRLRGTDPLS
jgi:hypothetical protein